MHAGMQPLFETATSPFQTPLFNGMTDRSFVLQRDALVRRHCTVPCFDAVTLLVMTYGEIILRPAACMQAIGNERTCFLGL